MTRRDVPIGRYAGDPDRLAATLGLTDGNLLAARGDDATPRGSGSATAPAASAWTGRGTSDAPPWHRGAAWTATR